jgi:histidine triad (HIT) family protein
MTENCIFCRIISGGAATELLYQDAQVTAFRDRTPAAPVHVLIVPNRHIPSLSDTAESDEALLGHILTVASRVAREMNIAESGYRVVANTGPNAGQTVFHLHFHLMGGQPLGGLRR